MAKTPTQADNVSVEATIKIHADGYDDHTFMQLTDASFEMERELDKDGKFTGRETWKFEGFKG